MVELVWEGIDGYHRRAKVPGGWLIKAYEDVSHIGLGYQTATGWDWRISMCFLPDEHHLWGEGINRSDFGGTGPASDYQIAETARGKGKWKTI